MYLFTMVLLFLIFLINQNKLIHQKSTELSVMLIKASKSPVTHQTLSHVKKSPNSNDVIGQIVNLTKQNQYLKSQIQCLKAQLDKLINSKNKYKIKYVKLKNQYQIKQQSKRNELHQMRREKSGKIYRQEKLLTFSPIIKPNQSNYDIPSTRSDLNRIITEPRLLQYSQNKFIQGEEQNPYHINRRMDKGKNQQYVLKINIGIQSMVKMLENMMGSIQKKQFDLNKFTEKISNIQTALSKLIDEIKDNFSKIQLKRNQKQLQIERIYQNASRNKSFSQQINEQNQQFVHQNRIMRDNPHQRYKDEQNAYGSNIRIKTLDSQREQEKLRHAKHHKSLQSKKQLRNQTTKSKIAGKDDKNKNEYSQCSSWQILNQIGKQLKDWRFSYIDSQPLQRSFDGVVKDQQIN